MVLMTDETRGQSEILSPSDRRELAYKRSLAERAERRQELAKQYGAIPEAQPLLRFVYALVAAVVGICLCAFAVAAYFVHKSAELVEQGHEREKALLEALENTTAQVEPTGDLMIGWIIVATVVALVALKIMKGGG